MHPLLIPELMPDEFLPGYERRIAIINGFGDIYISKRFVQEHFELATGDSTRRPFKAFIYAQLCKMDIHDLVRNHTLLPVLRSVIPYESHKLHGDPTDSKIIIPHTLKRLKVDLHFCPDCVTEDMSYHGFTYWRRSHQLPGIDWCSKHATTLNMYQGIESELYASPSMELEFVAAELDQETENNPIVRCFAEVVEAVLDLKHPIRTNSFYSLIKKKAEELGINNGYKDDKRPYLSDHALCLAPISWLRKHFPAFHRKTLGQLLPEFDHAVTPTGRSKVASIYNLLALSILFHNPSKCIDVLKIAYSDEPVPKLRYIKPKINQIIPQYIANRGNIHLMSKALGCHYTTLKHHMKKRGLPSLVNVDPHTVQAMLDYFSGASPIEVLARPDIDKDFISKCMRAANAQSTHVFESVHINQEQRVLS